LSALELKPDFFPGVYMEKTLTPDMALIIEYLGTRKLEMICLKTIQQHQSQFHLNNRESKRQLTHRLPGLELYPTQPISHVPRNDAW